MRRQKYQGESERTSSSRDWLQLEIVSPGGTDWWLTNELIMNSWHNSCSSLASGLNPKGETTALLSALFFFTIIKSNLIHNSPVAKTKQQLGSSCCSCCCCCYLPACPKSFHLISIIHCDSQLIKSNIWAQKLKYYLFIYLKFFLKQLFLSLSFPVLFLCFRSMSKEVSLSDLYGLWPS